MADYQMMPPLSAEEYAALKADIAEHGVQVPIEVDENGAILDGHHRQRICAELGLTAPTVVRAGLTEAQKQEHALRLNLQRRHLTSAQKRELIRAELKRDPDRSDRQIGRMVGADHKTVASVRRGEIPRTMFTIERLEHHPCANLLPMMTPDELASMAASIKKHGLIHPIAIDRDGRLVDGKCRLAACEIAEVQPSFIAYPGDPWDVWASLNFLRVPLSTQQKADIIGQARNWAAKR
jgi:ParB-like chromosome segregation protein Spo0J